MESIPRSGVVVLINPLHTGSGFKTWFHHAGIKYRSVYTFDQAQLQRFQKNFLHEFENAVIVQTVDEALESLNGERAIAVIPATEPSVPFADRLASRLGLAGNPIKTSMARRDKREMRELAGKRGVPIPRFELAELAHVEARLEQWAFPCVVKHRAGAGSNGVIILARRETAGEAIRNLPQTDTFGNPVNEVLIEDYIGGSEYAVNTLSVDGTHRLIDVWEYRPQPDRMASHPYWNLVQLAQEDPKLLQLWDAVQKMLDALDVRFGASHVEVKMVDQQIYLIELGNRLPGAHITDVWHWFQGINPYQITLDAYLGNKRICIPAPSERSIGIVCIAVQDLSTTDADDLNCLIEEFRDLIPDVDVHGYLNESSANSTENLDTMGAFVLLRASNSDAWSHAESTLRDLLRKGSS